jgi:hypothetical protein
MIKAIKNDIVDALFRASKPNEYPCLIQDLKSSIGPNVCFSIAFNTPWVINLLIRFWKKNVGDTTLVVADNSSKPEARRQIAEICRNGGVFYIGLPMNNRSHGISMNWIYYNIVKRVEPEVFGFIDHDCFPIAPFSLNTKIEGAKAYGFKRLSPKDNTLWNLWAGLTFMRYDSVRDLKLDFKPRPKLGLDTGGGNWTVLYSRFRGNELSVATREVITRSYGDVELRLHYLDDCFVHIGGASYHDQCLREQYKVRVQEFLTMSYLVDDPVIRKQM